MIILRDIFFFFSLFFSSGHSLLDILRQIPSPFFFLFIHKEPYKNKIEQGTRIKQINTQFVIIIINIFVHKKNQWIYHMDMNIHSNSSNPIRVKERRKRNFKYVSFCISCSPPLSLSLLLNH